MAGQAAKRAGHWALGKFGFWIAQPGLDAACQRLLVGLQRSRREVADVATAARRVELRIAELEWRADEDGGQHNTSEQLAELRRQHADLQNSQERATAISRRLMTEINAFRSGKEATNSAYTAAEEVARTVRHR